MPEPLIDCDFPGGNIILERIDGDAVYLQQDLRDTEGDWFYWAFRVKQAAGRNLTFHFTGSNCIGVRGPAYSIDQGLSWQWLGGDAVKDQSFSFTFPEDQDEIRFCVSIPYMQSDLERFLEEYENDPGIERGVLAISRKGREVERLHLRTPGKNPQFKIQLTARNHCCEMIADHTMEGLMRSMLADDDTGNWFRNNADVFIVPFVDKDGVEDGDQGKNRKPHDHNRDYKPPHVHVETEALIAYSRTWAPDGPDMALDLHCPTLRGEWNERIYIVGKQDSDNSAEERTFTEILAAAIKGPLLFSVATGYLPFGEGWNTGNNYTQGLSCGAFFGQGSNTRLSTSFELPYANVDGAEVNAESARAFGRDLAVAIRTYLEE